MLTVHTAPEDAQFQALYALGIFTVTDLCRYADANDMDIVNLLELANV